MTHGRGGEVGEWRGIPEEYRNAIVTGDARELAKRIPDESVDLIFTDPVYDQIDDYMWLAETAKRVLKPDSACLVWHANNNTPDIMALLGEYLNYKWQIIWYRNNEIKQRPSPTGKNVYGSCLWYEKGNSKRASFRYDLHSVPVYSNNDEGARHQWLKPRRVITLILCNLTRDGAIVLDPFTGGGTVPAVCKMLGRRYVAFEILPDVAEQARERIRLTQPPLFVPQPEQLSLMEE